jgi:hypothetical protein
MDFKEFLRPTRLKIFIFILLMIVTSLYSCLHFFVVGCIQGASIQPDGSLNFHQCPRCLAKDILPLSLGLIIPNYLIACLIIYAIGKIKNKFSKSKKKTKR